ncbi:hypothetical protein F2Q69_00012575 [Brassica cretica]|uniref:Uncharacterized protein n=1 Tax=Brassica cretica TaxID=69181 RepID=A0A8S9QR11_BRACR|nr:hypothetical protein F2Q69_00012575 [Brassica cretica]
MEGLGWVPCRAVSRVPSEWDGLSQKKVTAQLVTTRPVGVLLKGEVMGSSNAKRINNLHGGGSDDLHRLLGMAKPCRNVTGTATNSHHEREAILPSEKERVELCRYIGSANSQLHQRFTVDTEGTRERRIVIPSYFLRVMLVFVGGVGAVCVYDQPGDEATLVKQMVSDRTLPENHIDLISESSGVALLEPSRSIRRFFRFLQNPWQRGSETSGLAMLLVWACGAETFVP